MLAGTHARQLARALPVAATEALVMRFFGGGIPSPGQLRSGGWAGHGVPRGTACVGS